MKMQGEEVAKWRISNKHMGSTVQCNVECGREAKKMVYKVAVRPAEVTIMDKIRNEYIRGTAQVGRFGEKTREEILRRCGHLPRKDDGCIGRRMLRMKLSGKRKRGRPKGRFMDVVKEDMAEVEVTEEDIEDRNNWRKNPLRRPLVGKGERRR